MHHDLQPPFTDLHPHLNEEKKYTGKSHIAITPLTHSGCYQQLWRTGERGAPGAVVFIPRGVMLVVPADSVRCGGFLASPHTFDLSLEIVVLQDSRIDVNPHQLFRQDNDYPHCEAVSEGGLLKKAFNCDLTR